MSRIPIEFAVDKRAIPGMPEILRGLRWGGGADFGCVPIYFVTASPPQLKAVLTRKMALDGVEWDGIIFKDWLATLAALKPRRLREQLGFKLCALLAGRQARPRSVELLYGDDTEKDPEAFHLYSRLVAGDIRAGDAEGAMAAAGVAAEDRGSVRDLLDRLGPQRGRVERAFIHLERGTPPERFAAYAPIVVPVRGAAQLALALYELGHLRAEAARAAVAAAGAEGALGSPGTPALGELVEDALARGLVSAARVDELGLPRSGG
jgi:hypothetical protein